MSEIESYSENSGQAGVLTATVPQFQLNWIIDSRWDMTCFIGAAALGYGLFFLHGGLHVNMVTVWFLNFMLMDSPHFFGTYTRTYLDREEMQSRRRLLIGSLAFFAVGPVMVLLSYVLWSLGISWHKFPVSALTVFVSLWAYWHVVRQHFGILSLYKRKCNDRGATDLWLDRWILYLGLVAPFVGLIVSNQETRAMLGLSAESGSRIHQNSVAANSTEVWRLQRRPDSTRKLNCDEILGRPQGANQQNDDGQDQNSNQDFEDIKEEQKSPLRLVRILAATGTTIERVGRQLLAAFFAFHRPTSQITCLELPNGNPTRQRGEAKFLAKASGFQKFIDPRQSVNSTSRGFEH